MLITQSPITEHRFAGQTFYLKRDDKLHPHFSGNKARKLMALLEGDFPGITTLISYGSAQANSLYSFAALAKLRGWRLEFYVDHIPAWLKSYPIGNYRGALELGATIIETCSLGAKHPREFIQQQRMPNTDCLVIEEGARSPFAEPGIKQLALEMLEWIRHQTQPDWVVALPSGTGTTALYLHKYLQPHGVEVITCPCVGDESYLREQFLMLGETSHPTVLTSTTKHYFGHLYPEDYQLWQALLAQTHIEFDLLYDPLMWRLLSVWRAENPDRNLLYLHQGGLLGNESMLPRYQRQFSEYTLPT
ncbi:1-aminocyclopropane-1-carboxylate deaminase/D-cysteine desulfhydrase [Vibrio cholerae]|uniref:1-aminocyclopropane-1-carboxylate deaminase/D-cysteine desulfhydrase n=1 Tax=Vibrio cholerae TaxID=666 RepID=UPI00307FCFD2